MKHKRVIIVPKEAEYHLQRAMDAQGNDTPETILAHFERALSFEPANAAAQAFGVDGFGLQYLVDPWGGCTAVAPDGLYGDLQPEEGPACTCAG